MQYVNNDMDELFRRAAENYPLDTSNADWRKIATALQGDDDQNVSNKKRRALWLLLLVPLFLVSKVLYSPSVENGRKNLASNNAAKESSTTTTSNEIVTKENNHQPVEILEAGKKPSQTLFKEQKQQKTFALTSSERNSNKVLNGKTSEETFTKTSEPDNLNSSPLLVSNNETPSSKYIFSVPVEERNELVTSLRPQRALNTISNPNSKTKRLPAKSQKGFYAGAFASLDATSVKFQKVPQKGNDYGLVLGYQINNKWSVEAGAFIDKKYYYSEGQYFNTSKIYMPPNSKITEVNGDCKMIELPVSVKYNFSSSAKSKWFGTLGSSSYFMKNEDYSYVYYYTNSGTYASHYKDYKNSSTNLFSVVNISAGYEHRLIPSVTVRVEPYLKVPISGMGIGKLPLLSSGLHIGVVKRF